MSGRSAPVRLVRCAIMPHPISTPTAAGMIAPFVGITDPTVAPMPQWQSGMMAMWLWMNGIAAMLSSCCRAWSSTATPSIQALIRPPCVPWMTCIADSSSIGALRVRVIRCLPPPRFLRQRPLVVEIGGDHIGRARRRPRRPRRRHQQDVGRGSAAAAGEAAARLVKLHRPAPIAEQPPDDRIDARAAAAGEAPGAHVDAGFVHLLQGRVAHPTNENTGGTLRAMIRDGKERE